MQQQEERYKQQEERHQQQEERHRQQLTVMQQQLDEQRKSAGTFASQKQTPPFPAFDSTAEPTKQFERKRHRNRSSFLPILQVRGADTEP